MQLKIKNKKYVTKKIEILNQFNQRSKYPHHDTKKKNIHQMQSNIKIAHIQLKITKTNPIFL